jgi:type I restriction enzyme S subunit
VILAAGKLAEVLDDLTAGWVVRKIHEVAEVNPRIDKKAIPDDIDVSFVPMPAVEAESGGIDVSQTKLAKDVKKGFTAFLEGDVLFAKITPCMENGKMAIATRLVNGYGFGSTEFHVLRPSVGLDAKYLYYYVSSKSFRGEAERFMTGAVGQKRVSTTYIKEATMPIAPLEDQRRIVAEIEKQFSRLNEAVASLRRAKANLKRYKAAVLKAAVEGKLTEEWRKQNPDVEPASKLLERILAERRAKWEEAELAKLKAKDKEPKNDRWTAKYQAPPNVDTKDLPPLPSGWVWSNLEQLAEAVPNALKAGPFGSALKKSFYVKKGYKIYGQEQVIRGNANYGDYYIDENRYQSLRSCSVKPGDLLISLVGTIGRVLILPEGIEPGIINPRLIKVSLDYRVISPEFLAAYLNSPFVKTIFSIASHGGTMDVLNLAIVKSVPIPVPPKDEQKYVLAEFDKIESSERNLVASIGRSAIRLQGLHSSVLRSAFQGDLI